MSRLPRLCALAWRRRTRLLRAFWDWTGRLVLSPYTIAAMLWVTGHNVGLAAADRCWWGVALNAALTAFWIRRLRQRLRVHHAEAYLEGAEAASTLAKFVYRNKGRAWQ